MNAQLHERAWLLCSLLGLVACAGPVRPLSDGGVPEAATSSLSILSNETNQSDLQEHDAGLTSDMHAQWSGNTAVSDAGAEAVDADEAMGEEDSAESASEHEPQPDDPSYSAFSSHTDAGSPAAQSVCGNDEHEEGGVCVANERSCEIPNGQGVQEWRVNRWGACVLVSCDVDYHPSSGRCASDTRICPFSNGIGQQTWSDGVWGSCQLDRCNDAYHAEGGVCYDNVRPCTLPNGEGTQEWGTSDWNDCIPDECEDGYHIESIDCIADVRVVDVPYGEGNEHWDGEQWSAFVLTSCDSGYHDGGNASCLPEGQCATGYDLNATGDCLYVANSIPGPNGMELFRIPQGTFSMGSPESERGRSPNETAHWVQISNSFLMGMTEVTQGQWRAVTGENPSYFTSCGDNCPVESVGWYSTLAYANALSEAEGLERCYTFEPASCADNMEDWADGDLECEDAYFAGVECTGYRLPTEAEWEYAYRSGTRSAYYSGNIQETSYAPLDPNLDAIGWYGGNSGVTYSGGYNCFGWYFPGPDFCGPQPACGKLKNAWGLCDMSGNVWEWTWDYYGLYKGTATDPLGPDEGSIRVLRGGSWRYYAYAARAAYRYYFNPYRRFSNSGFRLVRTSP